MSAFLISFALGTALIFVMLDDVKNFRIRNEAVLFMAALFLVDALTRGQYHETLHHLSFAGLMFLLILVVDATGIFSVLLLILTLVYWLGAYVRILPSKMDSGNMKIPYGPAIAAAW